MQKLSRAVLPGLLSLALIVSALGGAANPPKPSPLVVGWSDEFNQMNWQPFPSPNSPDVSLRRRGLLRLSLGPGATCVPKSIPFYWASVSRVVDMDTYRYPILAVRAVNLKGPSWWDVDVQGYYDPSDNNTGFLPFPSLKGDTRSPSQFGYQGPRSGFSGLIGTEVRTPSLNHDGVILFDLEAQERNGLQLTSRHIRIRLNIAGTAPGGSVEYDWLRFVRREDAERLSTNPRISDLVVEP